MTLNVRSNNAKTAINHAKHITFKRNFLNRLRMMTLVTQKFKGLFPNEKRAKTGQLLPNIDHKDVRSCLKYCY